MYFEPSWQTICMYSCRVIWCSRHYIGRNHDSRTTTWKDHASQWIFNSRITAVFHEFSRFTLCFLVNSRITRNPFQTLPAVFLISLFSKQINSKRPVYHNQPLINKMNQRTTVQGLLEQTTLGICFYHLTKVHVTQALTGSNKMFAHGQGTMIWCPFVASGS